MYMAKKLHSIIIKHIMYTIHFADSSEDFVTCKLRGNQVHVGSRSTFHIFQMAVLYTVKSIYG